MGFDREELIKDLQHATCKYWFIFQEKKRYILVGLLEILGELQLDYDETCEVLLLMGYKFEDGDCKGYYLYSEEECDMAIEKLADFLMICNAVEEPTEQQGDDSNA